MEQKAQGAIEYLLIIGAAILVVAIVIIAVSGVLTGAKTDNNNLQDLNDATQQVKDQQGLN